MTASSGTSTRIAHRCLGLPYTVLSDIDTVRLVCGEDFRYTLRGPGLERWLPQLLNQCAGRRPLDNLLSHLDPAIHGTARQLLDRLYAERVLVDGTAHEAHVSGRFRLDIEGKGALADALREISPDDAWAGHSCPARGSTDRNVRATAEPNASLALLPVLCQESLDYEAAYQFNRRWLRSRTPWLWASTGAMNRGYVSPAFLPGAGPCLACLLGHFQRLSPVPEFYDVLIAHARAGQRVAPVPFPAEGVEMLRQLVLWKARQLAQADPPAALYRLHVLEIDTMEVTAHRVFADPECPECRDVPLV